MKQSIKSRLINGISASLLGQFLNVLQKIVLVPLFLYAWGANLYGEWLIVTSFIAYLGLTELGSQVYIVNRLTQAYSVHDNREFKTIVNTGLLIYLVFPLVAYVIIILLIFLTDVGEILKLKHIAGLQLESIILIMAFQFIISLPFGLMTGIYRAVGMLPRGVMLGNALLFMQIIFISAALALKMSIVVVSLMHVVPFLVVFVIAIRELRSKHPELEIFKYHYARRSEAVGFIKPSLTFLLIQLSQMLSIQGTVIVVGYVLGPIEVVIFFSIRTIANLLKQSLSVISHTVWPEITRLEHQGKFDELVGLYRFVVKSTISISLTAFIVFHYLGVYIYGIWLQGKVKYDADLMDLFILLSIVSVLWTAGANILMSINKYRDIAIIMVFSAVLSVILAYLLGRGYGSHGVVIGMIISELILPVWIIPVLLKKYNSKFRYSIYVKELLVAVSMVIIIYMNIYAGIALLILLLIRAFKSFAALRTV